MKKTKEHHNANKSQRNFEIDWVFRGQHPDKRTCMQWVRDVENKFALSWTNEKWTRFRINQEDGVSNPFNQKK